MKQDANSIHVFYLEHCVDDRVIREAVNQYTESLTIQRHTDINEFAKHSNSLRVIILQDPFISITNLYNNIDSADLAELQDGKHSQIPKVQKTKQWLQDWIKLATLYYRYEADPSVQTINYHAWVVENKIDTDDARLLNEVGRSEWFHSLFENDRKIQALANKIFGDIHLTDTIDYYDSARAEVQEFLTTRISSTTDVRIHHALNIVEFTSDSRLFAEQRRTVDSIENAVKDNVTNVAIYDTSDDIDAVVPLGWEHRALPRTANMEIPGCEKNFAYLKDIFNLLAEGAEDEEWLMFSNSDCYVNTHIYKELTSRDADIVQFHRQDVRDDESEVYKIGLDGFAIRCVVWKKIRSYIRDFVIGAPHWDTAVWHYFREFKCNVFTDLESLYHIFHEKTWDFNNMDAAGSYNKKLIDSTFREVKVQWQHAAIDIDTFKDTTVIMCTWGNDSFRNSLTKKVLTRVKNQVLDYKLIFVELLFEKQDSEFAGFIDGKHIIVRGKDRNKDIFQKEALWNIGAAQADTDYLIFTDNDIWSRDSYWFYKIRNKISEINTVVQGVERSFDTKDPDMNFQGIISKYTRKDYNIDFNPGLIYGMTAEYHKQIGGFNPLILTSMGDSAFIVEVFTQDPFPVSAWFNGFKFWKDIKRTVHSAIPATVDVNVIHEHHGPRTERNYVNFINVIDQFNTKNVDLIEVGHNGIVEWKSPRCKERKICREYKNMKTEDDIQSIFKKFKYKV